LKLNQTRIFLCFRIRDAHFVKINTITNINVSTRVEGRQIQGLSLPVKFVPFTQGADLLGGVYEKVDVAPNQESLSPVDAFAK
jgi:hypothetical protein